MLPGKPQAPPAVILPVSFIIPWFDPAGASGGGAETLCREYAMRLARAGHDVEVLTTCSRDHEADWYTDHHPAGRTVVPDGYSVERFPVRRGDRERFLDLNRRILHGQPLSFREERAFFENSIQSDHLAAAVDERVGRRILIALPYLFGITWRTLMKHPGKVILWPCLHDEGYARLKLVAEAHRRAAALIFNSDSEADLATRTYNPVQPWAVIGMGIDPLASTDFREDDSHQDAMNLPANGRPFFVCLGRQSPEKGTLQLAEMFRRFAAIRDADVKLLLAGKGASPGPVSETVVNLGPVSPARKHALLRDAVALVVPSSRESLSIVLLEALACATPVLVNGACEVTRRHVEFGQCGLWYRNAAEFEEAATLLLDKPQLRNSLGANGREYVRRNYDWERKTRELVAFLGQAGKQVGAVQSAR